MDLIDYEVTVTLAEPDDICTGTESLVVEAVDELQAAWIAGRYMSETAGSYPVKVVVERYEPTEGENGHE